ncbi:hypothetical protein ACFL2A_02750 [Thermodesulfobacteriota bacterium]
MDLFVHDGPSNHIDVEERPDDYLGTNPPGSNNCDIGADEYYAPY